MNEKNNFLIMLQAMLDKVKSIANIKGDIKAIEPKLPKVKIQGRLDKTTAQKELNTKLKTIKPKIKVEADTTHAEKKIKNIGKQKTSPTITPKVDNSQVVPCIKQAQKETKTLWDRFTNGLMSINLIRMGIQELTRAIRKAIADIKELDAIKTNIQMVSGTSDSGANAMMSSYNDMAKDLSSTTKDVGEAANEFLRMGESIASTNKLIKSSQVLSKVGMIESADSASYLISSLKGYKIAAENSMDVVSKLTSVDLEAAVSAGGLAEALSKCSNIANNSGVAMDRLIGYTATIGEVTQKSMSEVGNSTQSILSRMNNIKIGKFIDDETGESLSDTEAVLNKLGIKLRDTEDSYRSFDDVLDDVGNRWKDFTKVEQNSISVAIAGTRQRENFEALMNNYSKALKYSETAANSAGSALERFGVYQDSIQAKTNELTAAMESLSTNTISEELFSGVIEATTSVVELIDKTNLLKGTLAGLVTMGISKAFVSMATGIIAASKSTAQLTTAMALFDKGRSKRNLLDIGSACKGLSDQQLKLVLSTKGLVNEDRKAILTGMGLKKAEQEQTLATLGFANAENVATASTFSFKGALNSLTTAISMNPIGAIATAVSAVTIAFSVYKQHQEEVRQATEEAANTYKDSASSIDDYASRYQELHKALIAAKGNEEETYNIKKQLLELQTDLNDKFGDEKGIIDLVTESYKDQTEAIRELNKANAQTFLNENKKGIDKAEKQMTKARHYNLSYTGMIATTDKGKVLKEIAAQYKDQGVSILDEGDGRVTFSVHLEADAQSAYETINAFETDLRNKAIELGDEHMFDDVLDISSGSLNKAKKIIDKYEDIFKQGLIAEIAVDDSKAGTYSDALEAVEAYNDAVLKAENPYDDQNVAQAKENLGAIKDSIHGNEEEWRKYSAVFDDVFGQADTRLLEFNEALKADSGLQKLADDLEGLNDIDLQSLDQNIGENDSFDKLKEVAKGYDVSVNELIDTLVRLGYVQGEIQNTVSDTTQSIPLSISDTIDQLNTRLKPAMDSLKSAWQDIFTDDGFTLKNVGVDMLNSIKADIDELNSMEGVNINIDPSAFEDFARVLTDTSSTADDVRKQFDQLADTIVRSTGCAEVNSETFDVLAKSLEEMGLTNARSVLEEIMSAQQEFQEASEQLGLTLEEVANATYEETVQMLIEAQAAGQDTQALMKLAVAQGTITDGTIATESNVEALLAEAQAAGLDAAMLTALENIRNGNIKDTNAAQAIMEQARQGILDSMSDFKVDFDFNPAVKSAGKSGKKTADAYLEAFEKEYSHLKDMLNRGEISEAEYLSRLRALYTKYFKDRKKYLDEFKKYENEYLTGMLDLHNKALSGISTLLNRKISAANDAKDASISALEEEKEKAAEVYQAKIDAIEKEKDAIDDLIDEKNKKIDTINEEIDAIEKAAEARKKNIQLQKDQFILEKMLNQRTTSVYKEGVGFVFEADTTGIRDAREKVKEDQEALQIDGLKNEISLIQKEIGLLEEKKDALTKEQEAIQKLMDESNKYYDNLIKEQQKMWDSMIKNMEQQKSRWEELAEVKEIAEAFSYIQQVFGDLGYTVEDVLNGSDAAFEDFKARYISVINDMNSNSDFTDGLVYATDIAKENLGSFLDKTKEAAEGLDELGEKGSEMDSVAAGINKLSDSATSASTSTEGLSDNLTTIGSALTDIPETDKLDNLATSFTNLGEAIQSVADALGIGEEDAINTLVSALQEISTISLDGAGGEGSGGSGGVITQFRNLKTAIEDATNAISGGGESGNPDGNASASSSHGMGSGAGGGDVNGLIGAIGDIIPATDEALGSGGGDGEDSGAISQFNALKTAVDDVTSAIGTEGSVNGEGSESTFIGALRAQYETASEVLPEEISLFEELSETIGSCVGALDSMVSALASMPEIGGAGGINVAPHAKGTVGNAFANGTKYKGLQHDEKNALVSEYGQTEMTVLPNGKTIVTDEPTLMDLPKDTVIYNEEQTKKIMDNKVDVSGNAHADGTVNNPVTTNMYPEMPLWERMEKCAAALGRTMDDMLNPLNSLALDIRKETGMGRFLESINNTSNITNNNKNVQPVVHNTFNITMPNVTDSTTATSLMNDLQSLATKKFQMDW